jgi:hypothetical protein
MTRRLFDDFNGVKTWWIYNEADDTVTLQREQDVSPILEANKALYATVDENARWGELTRVAHIPEVLLDEWIKDGTLQWEPGHRSLGFRDQRTALRKLDDPEFLKLRTRPGHVSR